jgi:hypothetical protein
MFTNERQIPTEGNPFGYAFGTLRVSLRHALRLRQSPAEGDPPAALVSPPAVLAPND